jgi:hypothetical protein
MLLLEIRILGSSCKEIGERCLKMAESLLKRYATNFVEEVKLFFFLPISLA